MLSGTLVYLSVLVLLPGTVLFTLAVRCGAAEDSDAEVKNAFPRRCNDAHGLDHATHYGVRRR